VFGIQNYGSFLVAIVLFQIVPGPGTLTILSATARNGAGAGLSAVVGTLVGDVLFMIAAAVGLAAVMNANPIVFRSLQWIGAAYLCWMGVQFLRQRVSDTPAATRTERSRWTYARRAIAVSLTNPKVILFFVAFFPLFLRPESSFSTLVIMMIHVTTFSFLYQAGLVLVGSYVTLRLKAVPRARLLATRLAGIALVGFGIKLAASNR
jgi:threonine/homoserine/homoserine lactone efflux protein